ncbi:unnamed protein product [Litomosoides sigmodontis]|uniref:Uncharacterized protein n=1 Tax=Litomosoides sigmodontis TaxID=42156 RepID=A0A3P6TJG7_LITSI|nr:unnamed protein product [Litomosoides sigmodontis]
MKVIYSWHVMDLFVERSLGVLMLKLAIFLELLYLTHIRAETYQTGDNSTIKGCSSLCSPYDSDLTCLSGSLEFYERLLLAELKHFVAVQMHIDQWYKWHGKYEYRNYTQLKKETIAKLSAKLKPEDVIDEETIATVIDVLIDNVEKATEMLETEVPHFSCPLPCEYRYEIWRNVFVASMTLNFLLLLAIIPFIISVIKSDVPDQLVRR